MDEKLSYADLINGDMPPWVMRFVKGVGRAINNYRMIQGGDKVLIAASGGKDSLAMSLALSIRRRWLPVSYSLEAIMIDWIEHPIPEEKKEELHRYFDALDIDFRILSEAQHPDSFRGSFNCYLCARNRRRILFEKASQEGISLIAMGHHLDDLAETTLMNLCFRADFETMHPVQPFFDGKLHIIRPLIETRESVVRRLAESYDLPVVKPVCPYDQTNVRARLKPVISELSRIDKLTREHIYNAHDFSSCVLAEKKSGEKEN